jgi:hypothetical protein
MWWHWQKKKIRWCALIPTVLIGYLEKVNSNTPASLKYY